MSETTNPNGPKLVDTTKTYYDSSDADNFYYYIWGGNDIHIGLYKDETTPIFDASMATVHKMADMLGCLDKDVRVLDLGAGYGGAARTLARQYGCKVTCLNLSDTQNARNREMTEKAGLADKVDVVGGNFENLPFDAGSFDVAWCEDSLLHTDLREQTLGEVFRVLKPGGQFIFHDPMQGKEASREELQPILDRIKLQDLGSFAFYEATAKKIGFEVLEMLDLTENLVMHYTRVQQEMKARWAELNQHVSEEYLNGMDAGLGHWIKGGKEGYLKWGIIQFKKPA